MKFATLAFLALPIAAHAQTDPTARAAISINNELLQAWETTRAALNQAQDNIATLQKNVDDVRADTKKQHEALMNAEDALNAARKELEALHALHDGTPGQGKPPLPHPTEPASP
jgi:uncharacterized protein YlxW (UPF0749 family)